MKQFFGMFFLFLMSSQLLQILSRNKNPVDRKLLFGKAASLAKGATGGKPAGGAGPASGRARNRFPEGKMDTTTGLFNKFTRGDLLDSIESIVRDLSNNLHEVEEKFKSKLEGVQTLAMKRIPELIKRIEHETESLENKE